MINFKLLLSMLALGFTSYAHAYGDKASIETCTSQLPEGAKYDVSIHVDIDKTTQQMRFEPTFEMKSNESKDQQLNVDPFIECVSLLIGESQKPLSKEEEKAVLTPLFQGMVYN
ncbi:MAG TPA: hypothetical protein DCS35_16980 [Vibrio sp.]|nr:hypothetical protein [Vibrio sp.]